MVGWFFVRAFARFSQDKNAGAYAKTLILGITYALVFHALFDILLTFRFSAMLFLYLMMAYLLFTKLFYGVEGETTVNLE